MTAADGTGVYLSSGWLLWVRAGTLVAQGLDVAKGTLTGEPVTLADGVVVDASSRRSAVSVAATGLVAYRTGGAARRQLTWFDRSGKTLGTLGASDENNLTTVRVSPDGQRAAVSRAVQGNQDIWLLDGTHTSRLTFDAAYDSWPLWSPDGTQIVFTSLRKGAYDLYTKASSGAGAEEPLVESPQTKVPNDWSANGRFLLYHTIDPQTDRDLWVRPMTGDHTLRAFLKTPFRRTSGPSSRRMGGG